MGAGIAYTCSTRFDTILGAPAKNRRDKNRRAVSDPSPLHCYRALPSAECPEAFDNICLLVARVSARSRLVYGVRHGQSGMSTAGAATDFVVDTMVEEKYSSHRYAWSNPLRDTISKLGRTDQAVSHILSKAQLPICYHFMIGSFNSLFSQ